MKLNKTVMQPCIRLSFIKSSKFNAIFLFCFALLIVVSHYYLCNRRKEYSAKIITSDTTDESGKEIPGEHRETSLMDSIMKELRVWHFSEAPQKDIERITMDDNNKQIVEDAETEMKSLSICPAMPPNLKSNLTIVTNISLEEAERKLSNTVRLGGSYWPTECQARWTVSIIVPMREREHQMGPFLNHMHPFLQRQQINYTIYIVTQADDKILNKAKLLNIAFVESLKEGPYDCFVFHDIDLLPENNKHLYHCAAMPRHFNVAASNSGYQEVYRLKQSLYYGGVNMMTESNFRMVNGWSNRYFGWGGEDDDMRRRIAVHGLPVWRYPKEIARYTALPHNKSEVNPNRYNDLYRNLRYHLDDGLSTLQYKLISKERKLLFTEIRAI